MHAIHVCAILFTYEHVLTTYVHMYTKCSFVVKRTAAGLNGRPIDLRFGDPKIYVSQIE